MSLVKYLGHSSFFIEIGDKKILTDPWFDKNPKQLERLVPPAAELSDFKNLDIILVSHEHFDHCSPYDINNLVEKTFAYVVAPEETLAKLNIPLRNKVSAFEGDKFDLRGVNIEVTKAVHPQSVHPVGFVVRYGGSSFYFAGDTYDFYEMTDISVDLAMIPIGGTYTMDPFAAIKALKQIRCKYVVPMHYNTFKQIQVDLRDFERRAEKSVKAKVISLKPGESFSF